MRRDREAGRGDAARSQSGTGRCGEIAWMDGEIACLKDVLEAASLGAREGQLENGRRRGDHFREGHEHRPCGRLNERGVQVEEGSEEGRVGALGEAGEHGQDCHEQRRVVVEFSSPRLVAQHGPHARWEGKEGRARVV